MHEIDVNVGDGSSFCKNMMEYLLCNGDICRIEVRSLLLLMQLNGLLYNEWLMANPDVVVDRLTNVVSFYGTFTYTYDDRYTANFNIRTDGSNKIRTG